MKKFLYSLNYAFNADLLFWIVINNLFLSTVKDLTDAQIVLISLLANIGALVLYPLANFIISKISNRLSCVIGSIMLLSSSLMYTFGTSIYLFGFAGLLLQLSAVFASVSQIILKNNLRAEGKEENYVKVRSLGKLMYAIITCAIAVFCGNLFNINPYIPMYCCIACTVIGLILSIIYKENVNTKKQPTAESTQPKNKKFDFSIIKSKPLILTFFLGISFVGCLRVMQSNSSLLSQNLMEGAGIPLTKISIIISMLVLISRIFRIISNFVFPFIYNKMKNKSWLLILTGALFLTSSILFAIGSNFNWSIEVQLVLVGLGLIILVFVRDFFNTLQELILLNALPEKFHKTAFTLMNFISTLGTLLVNLTVYLLLLNISLNLIYACLTIFALIQMILIVPYAKYLNKNVNRTEIKE